MPEINIKGKVFLVDELKTKQVLKLMPTLKKFKIEPGKEWAEIAQEQFPLTCELLSELFGEPPEYFEELAFGDLLELVSSLIEANLGILKNLNSTLGRVVKLTRTISGLSLIQAATESPENGQS